VKLASDWASKREQVDTMRFNNALLKKVRAARPIISDKLWNTVLASVSTAFSRLRGEPSVVTKSKDGFTVNGKAVELLSGSTLDLLGLAIRTSLVKTFIPHCPFLVLDEPSAACDIDRTTTMLGFIHASGFDQVILVTHEDISQSVADNLIEL
jgi:DNA repair exonuclease SbcCD ATPase subunit